MSVPRFDKGKIYTLEQIKQDINSLEHRNDLSYYLKGKFKYLGV